MIKERNQSIELLRIILMTLIVFGHILGHGIGWDRYESDGSPSLVYLLQPLYLYHVDAFIFISGYYGIKFSWGKIWLLARKWIFYSFAAVILYMVIQNDFSISLAIGNIFPISTCGHWFMEQYLYLMLMTPLLNVGMESLTKKQASILILVLYISSFRLFSCLMVFVYLLGRYLRKYPIIYLEKYAVVIFFGSTAAYFFFNLYCLNKNINSVWMYNSMFPFVIVPAVSLFYSFQKIHIKWKSIGVVSSGVLATYLITDHQLIRPVFTQTIASLCNNSPLIILLVAFCITIICSLFGVLCSEVVKKLSSVF